MGGDLKTAGPSFNDPTLDRPSSSIVRVGFQPFPKSCTFFEASVIITCKEMHCYSQLVSCSSCFKNKNIHSEIRQQSNQSSLQYLPQNSRVGNTLNLEFIYRCGFSTHNAFNSKCMDSIKGLQATYEESEHINLTSLYEAFIQEDMVRIQRKLIKSLIFH